MMLWLVPLLALLNRARGGGLGGSLLGKLPGSNAVAVGALLIPIVFALGGEWRDAVAAGIGFALWGTAGWGGYFHMGLRKPYREVFWIDWLLKPIFGEPPRRRVLRAFVGMTLRQFHAAPLVAWFHGLHALWLTPVAALSIATAYLIGRRVIQLRTGSDVWAIRYAEWTTGAVLGAVIAGGF